MTVCHKKTGFGLCGFMKKMINKKIISILIALVIVGGLLFYWIFFKTNSASLPPLNSDNSLEQSSRVADIPKFKIVQDEQVRAPEQFDRCVGTIEEINGDIIKVKAEKDKNPFGQEMSFQITITPETKIWPSDNDAFVNSDGQAVFFSPVNKSAQSVDVSKPPKTLKLNDLQIGQSILVMGVGKFQSNNISAKFLYLLPPKP